jgi:hypothetical protein
MKRFTTKFRQQNTSYVKPDIFGDREFKNLKYTAIV